MNAAFGPFFVIALGLSVGFLLRKIGRFSAETPKHLNAYVISIALPALVLAQLPPFLRKVITGEFVLDRSLAFLPFVPWLIFLLAILFFRILHRLGWLKREEWGLLSLAAGLGNTAFVGFPLIEALLGREQLPFAILLDQLGTFLTLSIGGTLWITLFREGRRPKFGKTLRDLFRFPPFLALLISFGVAFLAPFPEAIQVALERFAGTLIPVAMMSVGSQLQPNWQMLRKEGRGLALGLGYKMALAPLLIFALARAFGLRGAPLDVAVLEAGMAPMITSTLLGIEAGFAPNLGALILGVGIPLSLLTVPGIHWWMSR